MKDETIDLFREELEKDFEFYQDLICKNLDKHLCIDKWFVDNYLNDAPLKILNEYHIKETSELWKKLDNLIAEIMSENGFDFIIKNGKQYYMLRKSQIKFILEDRFYTQNLQYGKREIVDKAIQNIISYCGNDLSLLFKITNYAEIGIVKYVANNQFYIENNRIVREN